MAVSPAPTWQLVRTYMAVSPHLHGSDQRLVGSTVVITEILFYTLVEVGVGDKSCNHLRNQLRKNCLKWQSEKQLSYGFLYLIRQHQFFSRAHIQYHNVQYRSTEFVLPVSEYVTVVRLLLIFDIYVYAVIQLPRVNSATRILWLLGRGAVSQSIVSVIGFPWNWWSVVVGMLRRTYDLSPWVSVQWLFPPPTQ